MKRSSPLRSLSAAVVLSAAALLLGGCQELQELRHIKALQDKRIDALSKELEAEKQKYHKYATTSSAELDALKARLETTEIALRRAQGERSENERRLAAEAETLRTSLAEAQRELTGARTASEELTSRAANRTLEAENLGKSVQQLQQQLEEKERLARQFENTAQQTEEKRAEMATQLKEAQGALDAKNKELASVQDELKKATDRANRLEENTKNLSTQISNLQDAMKTTGAEKTETVEKLRKEAAQLQDQIAKMKDGELVMDADFRDAQNLLKASLKPLSDADYATVTTDRRGVVIRLAASYLFEQGLINLDPAVQPTLDQIAEILNRFPRKYVEVQGHTDTQAVINLPFTDNWALASARAAAVVRYLTNQAGVDPKRVKMSSCSQYRLLEATAGKNPALDRRVEIVLGPTP